jgi:hypothetical protein
MGTPYRNVNIRSLAHHFCRPTSDQVMEDHVTGRRSSSGHVSPEPKSSHPPRFPDLPVAFLRILIDDPAGEVAHLM